MKVNFVPFTCAERDFITANTGSGTNSSLRLCVFVPGGAFVPEPKGGAEEQPAVHPGPAARHVPAPANHPVAIRGQNGDPRGERVFPRVHGEPDQQDQADHEPFQGGQGEDV